MMRLGALLSVFSVVIACTVNAQPGDGVENLYAFAWQLYQEGKYQASADSVQKAAFLYERTGNLAGQVKSLNLLGECKANLNQCDPSLEILNRSLALALANFEPESSEVAYSYYYLARSMGGCARRHNEAIALMHKSINLKQKLFGEGVEVAFDYTYMGYMFNNLTRYDSSLYYLEKAMTIRNKELPPDDAETANTLYHLGRTYASNGELIKSLELQLKSLRIRTAKLSPLHASLSNSLHEVGSIYQKLGNFDRALDYYQKALEVRIKSLGENHSNVAASYLTIGNLYGTLFNYRQAIHYLKQGTAIDEKIYGDKDDVLPTWLAYLGMMYGSVGEHAAALVYFKKAQTQAEKNLAAENLYLARVYSTIGNYYGDNHSFQRAVEYLTKATLIFHKSGVISTNEADVMVKLGTIHAANKNFSKAFEKYQLALNIYRTKMGNQNPKVASVYQLMGDAYRDQQLFEKSLRNYQKAFATMSTAFKDTVNLFLNPTPDQLENKPLALRVANQKAKVLTQMSKENSKHLDPALRTYLFAIDLMDDITSGYNLESARIEFEKESRTVYDNALNIAYQLYIKTKEENYIDIAFQISEKSKAAMLMENIRDGKAKFQAGVPDSLINKEHDLKIQLDYCQRALHSASNKKDSVSIALQEKNIFNTQEEFDKLKNSLEKSFPSYFNIKYNPSTVSLQKIRKSLAETTALLEFYVADSFIYKLTASKNATLFERTNKDEALAKLITDYEKSLTHFDFILNSRTEADRLYTSTAYRLYEILLRSSLRNDSPITKLIIIPDDYLAQFSFGTLLTQKVTNKAMGYKNFEYLTKQCNISYAYSTSLLTEVANRNNTGKNKFAGFAPSYNGNQFTTLDTLAHPLVQLVVRSGNLPLPGATEEVNQISKLMKGDSWINYEANETNFKKHAADYDILHLAMHSLLDNENPRYSELLFNHEYDQENDGYLNIAEIYNLKLNAAMVVLSACSSGFGKIQKGEGPISIARAFSYAGCPSVVMSLWKVPDVVTSQVMANFYRELKNGKQKDEALRLAQLKFLNETNDPLYHHPYFWAGFVVMGDTEPIPEKFPFWIIYSGLVTVLIAGAILYIRKKRTGSLTQAV